MCDVASVVVALVIALVPTCSCHFFCVGLYLHLLEPFFTTKLVGKRIFGSVSAVQRLLASESDSLSILQ